MEIFVVKGDRQDRRTDHKEKTDGKEGDGQDLIIFSLKNGMLFGTMTQLGKKQQVMIMKRIDIWDIQMDECTAKEAMQCAMQYMETEALNVIEMLNGNTIVQAREEEELRAMIAQSDLILIGDRMILEAAGIEGENSYKEPEGKRFLKMFIRYLHKNHKKVYLLALTKEEIRRFEDYVKSRYSGIKIAGTFAMHESEIADDMVVNQINGTEADCILSVLPPGEQESFVARNRTLLDSRLWIGLGNDRQLYARNESWTGKLRAYVLKQFLKTELEKEKKKNEV